MGDDDDAGGLDDDVEILTIRARRPYHESSLEINNGLEVNQAYQYSMTEILLFIICILLLLLVVINLMRFCYQISQNTNQRLYSHKQNGRKNVGKQISIDIDEIKYLKK